MAQNKGIYKPLLYIAQPEMTDPTGRMQQTYTSHLEENTNSKGQASGRSSHITLNIPASMPPTEKTYDLKEDLPIEELEDNKKNSTMGHEDSFKRLSIVDRITYLLNLPQYMPSLLCQIDTENKKYTGRVVKYEKPYVFVRLRNRHQPEKITLNAIKDIRITSF